MNPETGIYQDFGGLKLPIEDTAVDTTLVPLDPTRSILLALFASAINSELGPVWQKITDQLPAGHFLKGSTPVFDTLELPPNADTMGQRKAGWPLLALHRVGEGAYEQHTLFVERLTQSWNLHYILGPLDVGHEHKLGDICIAAAKIVRLVIQEGGHKSYQAGALQFFGDRACVAKIDLKSHEGPGPAVFATKEDSALYFALSMILETWEIAADNLDGYDDHEGTNFGLYLDNPEEGDPLLLIEADSDAPHD